jgi:hypothetical protein
MSAKILSAKPLIKVPPRPPALPEKEKAPPLADVAAVLLPGLQHASELIATAAKILSDLSHQPLQRKGDAAAEAEKAQRLLAAFGRPPNRG